MGVLAPLRAQSARIVPAVQHFLPTFWATLVLRSSLANKSNDQDDNCQNGDGDLYTWDRLVQQLFLTNQPESLHMRYIYPENSP